jgi:hypothetical protein
VRFRCCCPVKVHRQITPGTTGGCGKCTELSYKTMRSETSVSDRIVLFHEFVLSQVPKPRPGAPTGGANSICQEPIDLARQQRHHFPTHFRKRRGNGWGTLTVFSCRITRRQAWPFPWLPVLPPRLLPCRRASPPRRRFRRDPSTPQTAGHRSCRAESPSTP